MYFLNFLFFLQWTLYRFDDKILPIFLKNIAYTHSWAQQKLSPLSPLNILLSINGPLISFWFNGLND